MKLKLLHPHLKSISLDWPFSGPILKGDFPDLVSMDARHSFSSEAHFYLMHLLAGIVSKRGRKDTTVGDKFIP